MAGETKRALRGVWFQLHKWIGLVLMTVLMPLALSGSLLVWGDALDHAINPQRYAVTGPARLTPSAYVTAATHALPPGSRIATLRYPEQGGPVIVGAVPAGTALRRAGPPLRTDVWLDPASARVLDIASNASGLLRVVHRLHGSLLVPGVGRAIVGWLGVAMALSCASGLWLWWPATGRFVRALRWRRGDRRLDTNLHHLVGFWIVLPLAMLSVTGVWIAWPQMVGAGGGPRRPVPPAVIVRSTPDAALAAALAAHPGTPRAIAWPTRDGGWRVTIAGHSRPTDVMVDDTTGAATPAPISDRDRPRLARTMRRWHEGEGMGPIWQAVIVLAGLAPTLLGVTALTMWLRSRRWRRRARARPAA